MTATADHTTAPASRPLCPPQRLLSRAAIVLAASAVAALAAPPPATAAVRPVGAGAAAQAAAGSASAASATNGNSLEAAASKAGETGRKVATSLIALAFSIAAIVLTFKRDFKEAVGVFAVGIVAVLLISPAGINVLHDTVALLFGSA